MNLAAGPAATLRDLPRSGRYALAAICLFAVALRLWFQFDRPFVGDEVGTLLHIQKDYLYLLTHFEDWLTMNVYIVLIKFLAELSGGQSWILVAPSLVCGIAIVPLTAAVAVRVASPATANTAALLVAGNPYLIFYSVQIRSYILLAAFCMTSLLLFLNWCARPGWMRGSLCALFFSVALLMHANAVYFLIFLVLLGLIWMRDRHGTVWSSGAVSSIASLATPMFVGVAVAAATYVPLLETMREFRATWSHTPPTSLNYLPYVVGSYSGRGYCLVPSVVLGLWGLCAALRRHQRLALLAWGVVVPVGTASLLGVSHYPWAFARFFIAIVPILIIFIAAGVATMPRQRLPRLPAVMVLVVLVSWVPDFAKKLSNKTLYPWPNVAEILVRRIGPADRILTLDDQRVFTNINLGIHLGDHRRQLTSITDYLADPAMMAAPQRLFVVAVDEPIETSADSQQFGAVHLQEYTAATRTEIGHRLLDDLRAALTGKDADAKLTGQYRIALQLMEALSRMEGYGRFVHRYHACRMRQDRVRYRPPQLRVQMGGE